MRKQTLAKEFIAFPWRISLPLCRPQLIFSAFLLIFGAGCGGGGTAKSGGSLAIATPSTTPAAVTVAISPPSLTMIVSSQQSFTAVVTGSANTQVTWTATAGLVTGTGSTVVYTAPSSPTALTAPVILKATSVADPTASASAALTIIASGGGIGPSNSFSVAPAALPFGDVTLGANKTLSVVASNTSSGSLAITAINFTGSGYTLSGVTFPIVIAAGTNRQINIVFSPLVLGAVPGKASFQTNVSTASTDVTLSGNGVVASVPHSVDLSWNASTSIVVGYNAYRSSQSGGPYQQLNSTFLGLAFTDSTVVAGQTYFYVVTAVDSNGSESAFSNEAAALIPSP